MKPDTRQQSALWEASQSFAMMHTYLWQSVGLDWWPWAEGFRFGQNFSLFALFYTRVSIQDIGCKDLQLQILQTHWKATVPSDPQLPVTSTLRQRKGRAPQPSISQWGGGVSQCGGVVLVGRVLHDNDDADVTPQRHADFVALDQKTDYSGGWPRQTLKWSTKRWMLVGAFCQSTFSDLWKGMNRIKNGVGNLGRACFLNGFVASKSQILDWCSARAEWLKTATRASDFTTVLLKQKGVMSWRKWHCNTPLNYATVQGISGQTTCRNQKAWPRSLIVSKHCFISDGNSSPKTE